MQTVVTLTALNEAKNIGQVIPEIISQGYACILVDDGSTDGTPELAEKLGASVLRHCINLGQGYAVLTSFKAALKTGCDIIIEMDADGQHDPAEIPRLINRMKETGADIVVGSRILGSDYDGAPFFRKTFLPHFTWIINRLTGYHMTDAMCGFRAFKTKSLSGVAHLLDEMLEPQYIAAEMFIRFSRAGLRVEEVPIKLSERKSGHSYKGLVRYGFGVLKAISKALADNGHRKKTS